MENKDLKFNYSVMDANQSFFYVILMNVLAPFIFTVLLVGVKLLLAMGLSESIYNLIVAFMQVVTIPCLFIVFISIYHKKNKINIRIATNFDWRLNPVLVCICVLILVVAIVSFFPIINMIYSSIELAGYEMASGVAFPLDNWWQLCIGAIIYCMLPAIAEEIIFRGMVLKGTLNRAKPIVAILISSLAFFIMHGNLVQTFYQIVLGFLLSLICYYTKNILYPIIFHFLNNLAVILLGYFGVGGFLNGFSLTVGGVFAGVGLAIGGCVIIFALIMAIRHIIKKNSAGCEFVVSDNNIIVEEQSEKLGFRNYIKSLILDEKFYFYSAWVVAIVVWIFNSI